MCQKVDSASASHVFPSFAKSSKNCAGAGKLITIVLSFLHKQEASQFAS